MAEYLTPDVYVEEVPAARGRSRPSGPRRPASSAGRPAPTHTVARTARAKRWPSTTGPSSSRVRGRGRKPRHGPLAARSSASSRTAAAAASSSTRGDQPIGGGPDGAGLRRARAGGRGRHRRRARPHGRRVPRRAADPLREAQGPGRDPGCARHDQGHRAAHEGATTTRARASGAAARGGATSAAERRLPGAAADKPALRPRSRTAGTAPSTSRGSPARDPIGDELRQRAAVGPHGRASGRARTRPRGVHKAPANEIVRGALNLDATRLTREEQGVLNPAGVNCIRYFAARGHPGLGRAHARRRGERVALPQRPAPLQHDRGVDRARAPAGSSSSPTTGRCGSRSGATSARSSPGCGATARYGADARGGVLRQVRRGDQSAREHRRRPGRRVHRHRAGQARGVRRVPHQPARRGHRDRARREATDGRGSSDPPQPAATGAQPGVWSTRTARTTSSSRSRA